MHQADDHATNSTAISSHDHTNICEPSSSSHADTPAAPTAQRKRQGSTVVEMLMVQHHMYRGNSAENPITTRLAPCYTPAVHYLIEKGVHFAHHPTLDAYSKETL
jgi:hypothetical protein